MSESKNSNSPTENSARLSPSTNLQDDSNFSSIHVSHMYVYNLSPESLSFDSSLIKLPPKYQSPAASSGPICRICHEGDTKEDLVSPCRCTGTLGLVHKTCMERWLSIRHSSNDKCEICNYSFATIRSPKSFMDWFRSDDSNSVHRRSVLGDLTCFILLTPFSIVSSFLCIDGARKQVLLENSLEAGSLMAMATFLITMYFVWNILTFRFHLKTYLRWRERNHNVKLVRVQRISTVNDECQSVPIRHNMSPNVIISIPHSVQ